MEDVIFDFENIVETYKERWESALVELDMLQNENSSLKALVSEFESDFVRRSQHEEN